MERLAIYYGSKPPSIVNVYLSSHVDHYSASYGDKGWGCGYRNFQMLLSSLAANPTYSKVLFNGMICIGTPDSYANFISLAGSWCNIKRLQNNQYFIHFIAAIQHKDITVFSPVWVLCSFSFVITLIDSARKYGVLIWTCKLEQKSECGCKFTHIHILHYTGYTYTCTFDYYMQHKDFHFQA